MKNKHWPHSLCDCGKTKSAASKTCRGCSIRKLRNPAFNDALDLYLQGVSFREIAEILGVSVVRARQIFKREKFDFMLGVYVGKEIK